MAARRAGRGRLIGLAVLALALSPVLVLLVAPSRPPSAGRSEPAIAAHVGGETGADVAGGAAARGAEARGGEAGTAEGEAGERAPASALVVPWDAATGRVPLGVAAGPKEAWTGPAGCARDGASGGQYNRCLFEATRTSEQALEAELANAFAVIEARSDLAGVQRARWKTMLDEAQSRFLLYRNFDCQSVAPFEGPRGIGNFEQRALCLLAANTRRAADLHARYVMPAAAAPGPSGPQTRDGAWIFAVPPAVE